MGKSELKAEVDKIFHYTVASAFLAFSLLISRHLHFDIVIPRHLMHLHAMAASQPPSYDHALDD